MRQPFHSIETYELFLYTLEENFPSINHSSVSLIRRGATLARYDCQPHPGDPFLESSYPHHKHILPNLNRNRIPAPNMSLNQPNLPGVIREIDSLIAKKKTE